MHGYGQTFKTTRTLCPGLLITFYLDRISAHSSTSFQERLKRQGIPRLVSDLFNPLLLPPVVLGLLTWLIGGNAEIISWVSGIGLTFYTLIPMLSALYLLRTDQIQSLDLPQQASRDKLFILSISSSVLALVSYEWLLPNSYGQIIILALTFLVNILFGYLINRHWKISIHAAGISSAAAIFMFFAQNDSAEAFTIAGILSLFILLLLLPTVIWARYRLNIHSLAELFGGALTGFLLTFIELTIFIRLW